MEKLPEALRLADDLVKHLGGNTAHQAAAELRRLQHDLNEANHLAVYQSQRAMDYSGAFMRQKNLNAELVEALEDTHALLQAALFVINDAEARAIAKQQLDANRAFIAKATGEQP